MSRTLYSYAAPAFLLFVAVLAILLRSGGIAGMIALFVLIAATVIPVLFTEQIFGSMRESYTRAVFSSCAVICMITLPFRIKDWTGSELFAAFTMLLFAASLFARWYESRGLPDEDRPTSWRLYLLFVITATIGG